MLSIVIDNGWHSRCDAVERIELNLGPIDRLINAAAIMPLGLLTDQSPEQILRIMNINYGGFVSVAMAVLPRMRARGDFISYSSRAGHFPLIYMGRIMPLSLRSRHSPKCYTTRIASAACGFYVCTPAVATPLLEQEKNTAWPKMFDKGRQSNRKLCLMQ